MIKLKIIKSIFFTIFTLVFLAGFKPVFALESTCRNFLNKDLISLNTNNDVELLERLLAFDNIYQNTQINGASFYIHAVQFNAEGLPTKRILSQYQSLGFEETQRFYWIENLATPGVLIPLEGSFYNFNEIEFNSDGTEVRVLDFQGKQRDKLIFFHRVFDTITGQLKHIIHAKWNEFPMLLQLSKDFKTGLVRNANGTFSIFDYSKKDPVTVVSFNAVGANMSADGRFVVVKNDYNQMIFEIKDGAFTEILETAISSENFKEQFSADGRYVFIKDRFASAAIYSLDNGSEVSRFSLIRNYRVEMSPNGEYVLLIRGQRLIVINTKTGLEEMNLKIPSVGKIDSYPVNYIKVYFSADSKTVGLRFPSSTEGDGGPLFENFILNIENKSVVKVN